VRENGKSDYVKITVGATLAVARRVNNIQCGLKPALQVAFARRQPFFIWSSGFNPNKNKNRNKTLFMFYHSG
jgi:hypothetical protein